MWKTVLAVAAAFTMVLAMIPGTSAQEGQGANKITICHATGSATNPYVTITIAESGLHGHEGHAGDIIPAPAGGCPGVTAGSAPGAAGQDKITICHATGSATNPYVRITVSTNGLNGHDGHGDDIIPATEACPQGARVAVESAGAAPGNVDVLNLAVSGHEELRTAGSELTIVLSTAADSASSEVIDVSGLVRVRFYLNGADVPGAQVRVLLVRAAGGDIDLSGATPVANVLANGIDISGSSMVTFGAAQPSPAAPPQTAGGVPVVAGAGAVPGPAATGSAGLLPVTTGGPPWLPLLAGLMLAIVAGGRVLSRRA